VVARRRAGDFPPRGRIGNQETDRIPPDTTGLFAMPHNSTRLV
jgi:hypothetical protein